MRKSRKPQSAVLTAPNIYDTLTTLIRILNNAIKPDSRPLNVESNVFKDKIRLDNESKQFFTHTKFSLIDKHFHAPDPTSDNIRFLNRCRFQLELILMQEKPELLSATVKPAYPLILQELGCSTYKRDLKEKPLNLSDKATLIAEQHSTLSKLGCVTDMNDNIVIDAFQTQLLHDTTASHSLIDALVEIQKRRESEKLEIEIACKKCESFVTTAELKAAYRQFEIPDDGEGIDNEVLIGLIRASLNPTTMESLRIIAKARNDVAINTLLEQPDSNTIGLDQDDPTMDLFYAQNPVGLTNIGNTCYVNSLLQYIYTIKELRETVLNMEAYVENTDAADWQGKVIDGQRLSRQQVIEAKDTVRELKDLFSQMEWSKTRAVVPSSRLVDLLRPTTASSTSINSVITASEGQPYEMQDVSEAMLLLMSRLNAAFVPLTPDNGGPPVDRFNSLFYIRAFKKGMEMDDVTGATKERRIPEDSSTLILNADEDVAMQELIDNYFYESRNADSRISSPLTSIDGIGGDASIVAERDIRVTELPPILQIYLNRTQYNRKDNSSYKSSATISIPKRLYMDQYLESNQEENAERFKRIKLWKMDRLESRRALERIQMKRKELASNKQTDNGLIDRKYNVETINTASSVDAPVVDTYSSGIEAESKEFPAFCDMTTTDIIVSESDLDEKEAEHLGKIVELNARLEGEVAGMTRAEYKLHAVFHHEGDINFGHYWVDILDDQSQPPRWFKYSDERVNEVGMAQEDDILDGKQGPTACFCVYVRSDADVVQTVWRSIST
ncbi:hypothetical protein BCR41DRAFT_374314 [Lobosporangium transversale]|uniref:Ubiquitin carboxyl-terminal hydrolase n=1 Tax=Lobosporangium transversale TaxID=64571 RepID=A0A1Y2GCC6_9FUNG|nr:hypothetical protein BCR41DRAFT_374314 [Lobosporangium transversale]ORZ05673.1 hypothetical protein BCR41DRAFT_374314 [Lobosporangium transversale]|eukprot:XP_021877160.1 hypothetical protein BCR41DRAFT_374314 [Lobosporangium transversale]